MHQNIPVFIQALSPIISQYGYLAVGGLIILEDFGIPAPGETILITAAVFAGLGHLNIFIVIITAIIGAIIGDNIGFIIGFFGGQSIVEKYGKYIFLTPQKLTKFNDTFNKKGALIVVFARFIEGLRQLNGIIAGLSDMSWKKFIIYNSIGATLWVSLWASIGYLAANYINTLLKYQLYLTIVVIVGLIVLILRKVKRNKRTGKD